MAERCGIATEHFSKDSKSSGNFSGTYSDGSRIYCNVRGVGAGGGGGWLRGENVRYGIGSVGLFRR